MIVARSQCNADVKSKKVMMREDLHDDLGRV